MKKLFFFLLLSLLASSQVMACRCVNPEPKAAYTSADAVVLVKISAVARVQEDVVRMKTEVLQSWKLKVTGNTSILPVFSITVACSYIGQEGETHLLYLKRSSSFPKDFWTGNSEGFWTGNPEGFWVTANCMGNWSESSPQAAKHIRWLDRHGRKT
jgi:hypothetical protein